MPTVLLLTSFDTREKEALFLKGLIQSHGCDVLTLDIATGMSRKGVADLSCHPAAAEVGPESEGFLSTDGKYLTPEYVSQAGLEIVRKLFLEGRINGMASIGGTSNTTIASLIMKGFPFGFPKLILTSSAAIPAYASKFFADTDIAVFHSCVEINTLNVFVRDVLERFAGIVAGVLQVSCGKVKTEVPAIAVSEFKFSEGCASRIRNLLEKEGNQVVPFSATGPGERIMERMVEEGYFIGVIDLVPAGLSEALLGGNRASGMDRLDKELASGLPIILTPCGFDMLSCGPYDRKDKDPFWKKKRLARRRLFVPDRFRVQARTSKKEIEQVAQVFAEKLNNAKGHVSVFIPSRGFSSLSKESGPLFEPKLDKAFIQTFHRYINGARVEVIELNHSIDDPEFADAIVERFKKLIQPV